MLCAHGQTGQLSGAPANGKCPPASNTVLLPSFVPLTFCIHPYTGALSWMARGNCGSTLLAHVLPDDGPLAYCQHAYTGALRYSPTGK